MPHTPPHDAPQDTPRDTSPLLLETDQTRESFIRTALGNATARLLFQRAEESRAQALPGQDYARVECAHDGDVLCFCVCDGVGSSYQGEFAASYLAKRLVDWLLQAPRLPWNEATVHEQLCDQLTRWARSAQTLLLERPLPREAPAMVGEVLAELRSQYGSETVFFAGRVERIPASQASGALAGTQTQVALCWMGNIAAQLFTVAGQPIEFAQERTDRDRWSTARGHRGALHLRAYARDDIGRLIISTDGAADLEHDIALLGDDDLRRRTLDVLRLPTSDDVTILDLQWSPASTR